MIERARARYDAAVKAREFEIDLFWKRALFFWGFLAAAFVAVVATQSKMPRFAVVVASFGTVCAWTWTLANRGSKFWYESWETKVQIAELTITGPLFGQIMYPQNAEEPKETGWRSWFCRFSTGWMSARRFSVSRLAIGLSDYTFFVWVCILLYQLFALFSRDCLECLANAMVLLFVFFSIMFSAVLYRVCRILDVPLDGD
jgi:hypothetical protein